VESAGGIPLATENPDGTYTQSTLYSELHPGHPASTAQHAAVRGDDGHLYGINVAEEQVTVYDLTESERQGRLETTGTYPIIDGSAPIPSPKQSIFPGGPRATVVHVRDGATYPDRMAAERAGFPATGDSPLQQALRAQQAVVKPPAVEHQTSASPTSSDRVARTILFVAGHAEGSAACAGDAVRLHRMMADAEIAHQIEMTVALRHHKLLTVVQAGTNEIAERQIRSLTKAMRATGIGVSVRLDVSAPHVATESDSSLSEANVS
jgi:hypothetical protein